VPSLATAPSIVVAKVTVSADSAAVAHVTGIAGAVTGGLAPNTIRLTNVTTGQTGTPLTVAADGSFDTTVPATAGQTIAGVATDSAAHSSASTTLGTVPAFTAPAAINTSLITITATSPTSATVNGAAGAITGGLSPVTASITNTATNATVSSIAVAANGSFTATVTGSSGQVLNLSATDGGNRVTGPVTIGAIPSSAPSINVNAITIGTDGQKSATVSGNPGAISGLSKPLTAEVRNDTKGTSVTGVAIANDGSFSASITAIAGERLSVKVTDATSQTAGPIVIGTVPFGTSIHSLAISSAQTDALFRARTLAVSGNRLLVAGYPNGSNGDSPMLVQIDVSNPAAPSYVRTINAGSGAITGLAVAGSRALAVSTTLSTNDLNTGTSTTITGGTGSATAITIAGTYAFVASDANTNGTVRVYDISDPSAPRFLREQSTLTVSGVTYRTLLPLGSDYLVALSPDKTGAIGHDVVVLDRRDVNALRKVSELDIAEVDAFRGKVVGNTLYVAGQNGGLAIVDLSTPSAPARRLATSSGIARGLDLAGSVAAVADDTAGVTFIDTDPASTRVLGTQPIGGASWDSLFSAGTLYVANEQGIVIIEKPAVAPVIDASLINASTVSSGASTVTGGTSAITGHAPIALELRNGVATATATRAADGSFTGTITANAGDALSVAATDNAGRVSVRPVTKVPFGSTTTQKAGTTEANDPLYVARRVALTSSYIAATSGSTSGVTTTKSNALILYALPNASSATAFMTVTAGDGGIEDVAANSNYVFTASKSFTAVDLSVTPPVAHALTGTGNELALLIDGNRAYAAIDGQTGAIRTIDITSPNAPALLRDDAVLAGVNFRKLLALDANTLVAITPDKASSKGHDVVVVDRSTTPMTVKADFDVASFDAIDGVLDGNTLYLAGADGGVAAIDLSTPSTPAMLSTVASLGIVRGLAVSGTSQLAVAGGSSGITFLDVADKHHPVVLGTQQTPGNAIDVKVAGKAVIAATEQQIHIIQRP
jgi:hypothetical protein